MKSEHRHELQTNDLSKLVDKAGHALEDYYNVIMYGTCAVLLVSAAWIYWSRSSAAAESAAWREIATCRAPEDFRDVANRHPGTEAAAWARLHEADGFLGNGIRDAFSDRAKALTDLNSAIDAYRLLVDGSAPPPVRERAIFGLARALETTSDGDLSEAVKYYEMLIEKYPESVYLEAAERQIAALKKADAQNFYAWFHAQDVKPPAPATPNDTGPGNDGLGDLEIPDILTPKSTLPGGEPRLDEGPSLPDTKPEGETPATPEEGEKPASETPEGEKPESKPADEKPSEKPADGEKPAETPEKPGDAPETPSKPEESGDSAKPEETAKPEADSK